MVTTRRRTRSQGSAEPTEPEPKQEEAEQQKDESPKEQVDNVPEEEGTPPAMRSKRKKSSTRELRKQQREQARAKELGLIQTVDDSSNKPKKIVFDDSEDEMDENEEEDNSNKKNQDPQSSSKEKEGDSDVDEDAPEEAVTTNDKEEENDEDEDDDDDDDDDAVEQMDSRIAKDMALEERQREKESKAAAVAPRKRKRKSRIKQKEEKENEEQNEDEEAEEELFEDDFFAELDAQKNATKKKKKQNEDEAVERKHTIFQSSNDEQHTAIEVNPGMELVVLDEEDYNNGGSNDDNTNSLSFSGEPSETAMLHSRGQIVDGSDIVSQKQKQKHFKHGRKPPEANWKRSKKMNRLLLTKGKGKAAHAFVVKTYKF